LPEQFRSVPEMFLKRVERTPDAPAFLYPRDNAWKTLTWKQTGEQVRAIASGLRALGLKNEQRCAIVSGTRVEWILADLGILSAGGATTTIYPSNTPDECAYILKDSGTSYVFAEDDGQVEKLVKKRGELAQVQKVITFDGKAGHGGWVITLEELMRLGREHDAKDPAAYERVAASVQKDQLATLIYTSGTTGLPKGVELPHDVWLFEGEAVDAIQMLSSQDVQYLWLPLAHAFGKVLEIAQIRVGFPTAVDGRVDKLVENLAVIKPTFVCAVPRIFEKVHNRVVANAKEGGGLKYRIFQWAMGVGRQVSTLKQQKKEPSALLGMKYRLAHKLVFSKMHARFGGRVRFFLSGSAPLSQYLSEFFHAAGINILEGYGLTETGAGATINRFEAYRFGTVGKPLEGVQVKLAPEDGEILIKGRNVMRGYHNLPEATAEALDKEGWLHTGDIGVIEDGFIRITDRKKDLIKTSGGKYVAPQALEGRFKAICPYVSQIVVHGNNRNFCSALISLDDEAIKKWAAENGLSGKSYAELAAHEKVRALIQQYVSQLNAELPSYETVKKFALLPQDLTLEAGDMTPSLKVKRKAVEQKYKSLLDGFYAGSVADA
jgi:long-chain acyl-CoA synthetase